DFHVTGVQTCALPIFLWAQTGTSAGRHHDPELTELGHTQAKRLAEAVADGVLPWRITHVHTSLMTRAVQTATPLADVLDLPLLGHMEAHEIGGVFIEDDEGVRTPHPGAAAEQLMAASTRLVLPPRPEERRVGGAGRGRGRA